MRRCFFVVLTIFLPIFGYTSEPRPIVLVIGTRPEAVKMLPLYASLQTKNLPTILCSTGQQGVMLDAMYGFFDASPDVDFKILKIGQDLFYLTEKVMTECRQLFEKIHPRLVVVQGDTTTALGAALAAFYLKIPVAHVEAGLRTGSMMSPFPEEFNRRCISLISSLHFAPTEKAADQLAQEGFEASQIFSTGNTVVDALRIIRDKLEAGQIVPSREVQEVIERAHCDGKKLLMMTMHRRESIPDGMKGAFLALKELLSSRDDLVCIYPMHPNPAIRKIAEETGVVSIDNIAITAPMTYQDLVYTMIHSDLILTDSGGVQEEAISLQKPLLVLRNETDRPEGLVHGLHELVGTDRDTILSRAYEFLLNDRGRQIDEIRSVYGDGYAAERIAEIISERFQTL